MITTNKILSVSLIVLLFSVACNGNDNSPTATQPAAIQPAEITALILTSPVFSEGATIPEQFTCDGANISPALEWEGIPAGAASLALIMDDPDAGGRTWVHWVLYDIAADTTTLPEAVNSAEIGTPGLGSSSLREYSGPCPPSGTHRYFFKLYALDTTLDLEEGANKADVEAAMEGHILAEAQLMGTYQR